MNYEKNLGIFSCLFSSDKRNVRLPMHVYQWRNAVTVQQFVGHPRSLQRDMSFSSSLDTAVAVVANPTNRHTAVHSEAGSGPRDRSL